MAKDKKVLELTDEHLALISNIHFQGKPNIDGNSHDVFWGIDFNSLYGGSFLLEDISLILGEYDKHIEGSEERAMGPEFPDWVRDHYLELHRYIVDNIEYIEDLVHCYIAKGGIQAGTYVLDSHNIWRRK